MFRVITLNLNGIRSAAKKGFFAWIAQQHADVICVQETKCQMLNRDDPALQLSNYHSYFADAQKPGYSGVGIYCRSKPEKIHHELGWAPSDHEGRYLQIDYAGLSIVSLYMPSGTTGDIRQAIKYKFMDHYHEYLQKLRHQQRQFILCGDWNIAHTKMDIKNWRGNQKHSGFLPEERAWLDTLFNKENWVDAFRVINQEADQYTWWSTRGRAWDKNVGWRIDYQIVSPGLKDKVKHASIYKEQRFSDHAPLIIDYNFALP